MKSILKILFLLLILVFAIAIAGIFLPTNIKVVQIKDINASPGIVFEQINNLRNWENWYPWMLNDASMKIEYDKVKSGNRASLSWKSTNYGECKLTLTHSVPTESIAADFNFGLSSKTNILWFIEPRKGASRVNLTLNVTGLSYFERYFAIFSKRKFDELAEQGMVNLELITLKLKYSRTSELGVVEVPSIPTVIKIDSAKPSEVFESLKNQETYLNRFFDRRKLEPVGQAFKLSYGMVNDTLEKFAYGYPIAERTWVWRTLKLHMLPEGNALTLSHFGKIENIKNGHEQILNYIRENNLLPNGTPWEVYMFDPLTDLDTTLWETQIFFPVKPAE